MGKGISISSFIFDSDDDVNGFPYPDDLLAPDYRVKSFSVDSFFGDLTPGFANAIVLGDGFDPKLHIYDTTDPFFGYTKVVADDDSYDGINSQAFFFTNEGATYDAVVESMDILSPGETRDFYFEVQVDDVGNSEFFATNLGTVTSFGIFQEEFVGVTDANDYYSFTLNSAQTVDISLSGLSGDIDVELLDSNGFFIDGSFNTGSDSELIQATLNAGTYYVNVNAPFAGDTARAISTGDVASNYFLSIGDPSPINDPPTDVNLSANSIRENQPANTVIGDLSAVDPNAGDTHTYSLAAGVLNNDLFTIEGNKLKAKQAFDYEAVKSYRIKVAATDQGGLSKEEEFTINVTNDTKDDPVVNPGQPTGKNQKPTDISLSNASVAENQPAGAIVGNLSTTDPDAGNTHSYALVTGDGSTDNSAFTIEGNVLKVKQPLDFEAKNAYTIRVQTKDQGGLTYEEKLTIAVTDVNENPFLGDAGNNIINGDAQNNQIDGREGDDLLSGFGGDDIIVGGLGNDTLFGNEGNDNLQGGEGNDLLNGGLGTDKMAGGGGNDRFVFGGSVFSKSTFGIDTISDFEKGIDKIVLSRAAFTKLKGKSFASVKNLREAKASDKTITYISKTGALFYNQNGVKDGFGVGGKFADLADGLTLAKADLSLLG